MPAIDLWKQMLKCSLKQGTHGSHLKILAISVASGPRGVIHSSNLCTEIT